MNSGAGRGQGTALGTAAALPHQAVQLGDGALAAGLADVPDLDAALAAGVDVARGVADGDGAHHLAVAQRVDLPRVPRDAGPRQRVVRERHRLHLPVRAHVERVGPARGGEGAQLLGRSSWGLSHTVTRRVQASLVSLPATKHKRGLRFASRDGRQAGGQARGSHGRVRVKPDLPRDAGTRVRPGTPHSSPSETPGQLLLSPAAPRELAFPPGRKGNQPRNQGLQHAGGTRSLCPCGYRAPRDGISLVVPSTPRADTPNFDGRNPNLSFNCRHPNICLNGRNPKL